MGQVGKTDRIELRVTRAQKAEIEQAAAISGRTVTDFSVTVLVREAEEVIRFERELHLSKASWESFNAVLDRPAAPVAGLARLLRRPSVFDE